jgi:hypothetical protein
MAWESVGAVTVGPNDQAVAVGTVVLAAGADTLWVRVTQQGGQSPWPYGYGLLSWRSVNGRELGTAKVFGHLEGETYRLAVGRAPDAQTGVLFFEPRSYNLRWLSASASTWTLEFSQQSGVAVGGGGGGGGTTPEPTPTPDPTPDDVTAHIVQVGTTTIQISTAGHWEPASAAGAAQNIEKLFDGSGNASAINYWESQSKYVLDTPIPTPGGITVGYAFTSGSFGAINDVNLGGTPNTGLQAKHMPDITELRHINFHYYQGTSFNAYYYLKVNGQYIVSGPRQVTTLVFDSDKGFDRLAAGTRIKEAGGGHDGDSVIWSVDRSARTVVLGVIDTRWSVGSAALIY